MQSGGGNDDKRNIWLILQTGPWTTGTLAYKKAGCLENLQYKIAIFNYKGFAMPLATLLQIKGARGFSKLVQYVSDLCSSKGCKAKAHQSWSIFL